MLPKPAFKYSEALRQAPLQFNATEQMEPTPRAAEAVITCPECLTSFAVEQQVLRGTSSPKFHCSKCDSIFSVALTTTPTRTVENPLSSAENVPQSAQRRAPSNRMGYPQSSVRASDFSIGTKGPDERSLSFSVPQHQTPAHEISMTPRSGISLLEVSGEELDGMFEALPFVSDEAVPLPNSPLAESAPIDNRASVTEKLFSGGFEIAPPSKQLSTPQQPVPRAQPKPTHANEPRTATTTTNNRQAQPERIDDETFNQALEAQRGILQRGWHKLSTRNRSLMVMGIPLLLTLGSLLLLTPLTTLSPQSIGALIETAATSIISSPISQTPPSSLAIKNASLRFVRTRSNESLAVISGELVNTSNSKISGVNLEALVFNRRGEMLASSRAQLHSALAKENVTDLNLTTVRKFQNSLNARSASIGGGETVPFTIAILNESVSGGNSEDHLLDLTRVKYFSARVFSVN